MIINKHFNKNFKYKIKLSTEIQKKQYQDIIDQHQPKIKTTNMNIKSILSSIKVLEKRIEDDKKEIEKSENIQMNRNIKRNQNRINNKNAEIELLKKKISEYEIMMEEAKNNINKLNDVVIDIKEERLDKLFNLLPNIIYTDDIELIQNQIPIDEILNQNTNRGRAVGNLLKIGGINDFNTLNEDPIRIRINLDTSSKIISQKFSEVWNQEKINISLYKEGNLINIEFKENVSIASFPDEISVGFQWFISFFAYYIMSEDKREKIILFDEPALKLHPKGQKDFIKILEGISQNNQIIYTSHSPFLINRNYPDRIRLVTKEDGIGTKINNKPYADGKSRCWEPLRSAIGISLGDLFSLGESNIIVEGYSEQILLSYVSNYFIKLNKEFIDLNNHTIYPADGAGNVPYVLKFAMESDLNPIVILDSDNNGIKAKGILEKNIPSFKKIIMVGDIKENAKTMEDLLPLRNYINAINTYYSSLDLDKFNIIGEEFINKVPWEKVGSIKIIEDYLKENEHELNKIMVLKEYFNLYHIDEDNISEYEYFNNLYKKIISCM